MAIDGRLDPTKDTPHDALAINLEKTLNAAPSLKAHPDIVYHVAHSGGNVEDNAQLIAGIHLIHQLAKAVYLHVDSNKEAYKKLAMQNNEKAKP